MRNCCYVAVCSTARGASAPTVGVGGEGRGISWRPSPTACSALLQISLVRRHAISSPGKKTDSVFSVLRQTVYRISLFRDFCMWQSRWAFCRWMRNCLTSAAWKHSSLLTDESASRRKDGEALANMSYMKGRHDRRVSNTSFSACIAAGYRRAFSHHD